MGNEAAAIAPSRAAAASAPAVGSDALVQGLLLMRASAIKVVRLQLAMERRDRRAAIETVDDLMNLDRRISDLLDGLPTASEPLSRVREEVDAQGRALAREKLTLAAGMAGPRLAPRPVWVEPAPSEDREDSPAGPALELEPQQILVDAPAPARRGSSRLIAALLVLALVLAAAAALFLTSGPAGDSLGRAFEGVLR